MPGNRINRGGRYVKVDGRKMSEEEFARSRKGKPGKAQVKPSEDGEVTNA
jgi:hypothetical protein